MDLLQETVYVGLARRDASNEEIRRVVRDQFSHGELFTVPMVARVADVSVLDATSALASLPDGELVSAGRVEFLDGNGELVGPAYAYRYRGGRSQ